MTAQNLGTVFGPTLMRCPDLDPLACLTAAKYEKQIAELLIQNHAGIFAEDGAMHRRSDVQTERRTDGATHRRSDAQTDRG